MSKQEELQEMQVELIKAIRQLGLSGTTANAVGEQLKLGVSGLHDAGLPLAAQLLVIGGMAAAVYAKMRQLSDAPVTGPFSLN
jgi:hypothetical protein